MADDSRPQPQQHMAQFLSGLCVPEPSLCQCRPIVLCRGCHSHDGGLRRQVQGVVWPAQLCCPRKKPTASRASCANWAAALGSSAWSATAAAATAAASTSAAACCGSSSRYTNCWYRFSKYRYGWACHSATSRCSRNAAARILVCQVM